MTWVFFKHEFSSSKETALSSLHCIQDLSMPFQPQCKGVGSVWLHQQWTDLLVFNFFWLLFVTGQVRCFRMGGWLFFLKRSIHNMSQKIILMLCDGAGRWKGWCQSLPQQWQTETCAPGFLNLCLYQYQFNTLKCKLLETKASSWDSAVTNTCSGWGLGFYFILKPCYLVSVFILEPEEFVYWILELLFQI